MERITAVRDAGIAAPRKAELILMDMEIVQLVGAVDQLPYLAAMEGRADMWTGREVVTGVAVRPGMRKLGRRDVAAIGDQHAVLIDALAAETENRVRVVLVEDDLAAVFVCGVVARQEAANRPAATTTPSL